MTGSIRGVVSEIGDLFVDSQSGGFLVAVRFGPRTLSSVAKRKFWGRPSASALVPVVFCQNGMISVLEFLARAT